jgi:hypothetical protein
MRQNQIIIHPAEVHVPTQRSRTYCPTIDGNIPMNILIRVALFAASLATITPVANAATASAVPSTIQQDQIGTPGPGWG